MISADSCIKLQTLDTIKVENSRDIAQAIEKMVLFYKETHKDENFSFRILLPKKNNDEYKTKKMGVFIQSEFLLALRKSKLKPNIRDLKYIHNDSYYGWILLSPKKYDQLEYNLR